MFLLSTILREVQPVKTLQNTAVSLSAILMYTEERVSQMAQTVQASHTGFMQISDIPFREHQKPSVVAVLRLVMKMLSRVILFATMVMLVCIAVAATSFTQAPKKPASKSAKPHTGRFSPCEELCSKCVEKLHMTINKNP